ncbi:uncharacterized protein [Antedon mediterranea]|uniref:uncharacterized protein n=1 Tax=Antedon mediterranea TaxID=105859 RepID=UPI003AF97B68
MEDSTIPDENILVSSNPEQAIHSRLHKSDVGWRGANSSSQEWIQADLGAEKLVTGTILQGCDNMEWVTSYHVNHSSDGVHFEYAMNERNAKLSILFDGNVDRNTPVTNLFYYSVVARFIRIIAVDWQTQVCIRFELIGCKEMDYCSYYSPCENGAECVNMENTYNCTCLDGNYGRNCEIVESTTTSLTTGQSTTTYLTTGQSMTTSLTTGQSTTTSLNTDELEDRSTLSWSTSDYTFVYIPNEVVRMFSAKAAQLQSLHSLDQMLVQVKHNATYENIFNFVKNVLTVTSTFLPSIKKEDDKFKIVSMNEVLYKIAASLLPEDDIIEIDSEYQFVNIRKMSSSSSYDVELDLDRVNEGEGCSVSMSISLSLIPDDFLILVIFYQNRPLFYGTTDLEFVSKEKFIGSGVVTISLFNSLLNKIPLPVNITMRHLKNVTERILADDLITECVFWNVTYKEWFDNDCMTFHESQKSTTCICDHTTSYAILVGSDVDSGAQEALSMITTILCVSSVCCLCLTLLVYMSFEELRHSERNNIHKNLVFSLLLAQLFFLVSVDNVKEKILCTAIAIILHYLYLSVFTWMTIEGVNLYLKIVRVFNSDILSMRAYMIIGWGLPVVIVGVSVAVCIDGYGMVTNNTDKPYICWIDITSPLLYAFIGPILVTILVNSFVSVIVGRIIFKKSDSNDRWKDARSTLKGVVTLLPLLGLPWILCLFAKNSSIALATIFTVCNAPQGVFLFCTHCLFSKEVRTVMTSRWLRRKAQSSIGPQTLTKTSTTVTTNALPWVESN